MPNSAKKIICIQLNEIEDIPEKTLSESRNYTLICFINGLIDLIQIKWLDFNDKQYLLPPSRLSSIWIDQFIQAM